MQFVALAAAIVALLMSIRFYQLGDPVWLKVLLASFTLALLSVAIKLTKETGETHD